MTSFTCKRCGYNHTKKDNIVKHFNRKNICKPIICDISMEECMKVLNRKKIRVSEIEKLKEEINILIKTIKDKDIKIIKFKETINNQQDEINQLKMSQIPVKEEQSECIYLLIEREFIDKPLKVAKIGRSICFKNRMNQYPKGSPLLCVNKCNDSVKAEKDLLTIFNCMFKQRSDIGDEYFEGETSQMIKQINGYFYNNT